MRPVTGERFTWQSNTFMKTEMRVIGSGGRSGLGRRHRRGDQADPAVGRRDHEAVAHRRDRGRIAEEVAHPQRQDARTIQPSGDPDPMPEHERQHEPR